MYRGGMEIYGGLIDRDHGKEDGNYYIGFRVLGM